MHVSTLGGREAGEDDGQAGAGAKSVSHGFTAVALAPSKR